MIYVIQRKHTDPELYYGPIYAGPDLDFALQMQKLGYTLFKFDENGKFIEEL